MAWVGLFFPKDGECSNPLRVAKEVKKNNLRVIKGRMETIYEMKYIDTWYPAELVASSGMYEHAP